MGHAFASVARTGSASATGRQRKAAACLGVALLLALAAPAGAAQDTRTEVERTGRYSPIGMVVRQSMAVLDDDPQPQRVVSIGTAYLVDTCHIVTNNHLIQAAGEVKAAIGTADSSVFLIGSARDHAQGPYVTMDGGGPLPSAGPPSALLPYFSAATTAFPVAWGPWLRRDYNSGAPPEARFDWALMRLSDCLGERYGAVSPYAPLTEASVGGWVVGDSAGRSLLPEIADVVGHPRDRGVAGATVSLDCNWRPFREELAEASIHSSVLLSSNCPTVPGNSGGPVLVATSEVDTPVAIGLVTGAKLGQDSALSFESVAVSDRAPRLALTLLQQRAPAVSQTVEAVQRLLQEDGLDPGGVDGVAGPRTVAAVEAFRERRGREPYLPAGGLALGYPYAVTADFARVEPQIDTGLLADLQAAAGKAPDAVSFDGRWCGLGAQFNLSLQAAGEGNILASFRERPDSPVTPSVRHAALRDGARLTVMVRHPTVHGQLWWLYLSAVDDRLLVLDALVEAHLNDGQGARWDVHPLGVAMRRCFGGGSTALDWPGMFAR